MVGVVTATRSSIVQLHFTYRPSTVGDVLLAKYFQKPISCATNLQIVNAGMTHASILQINTWIALRGGEKWNKNNLIIFFFIIIVNRGGTNAYANRKMTRVKAAFTLHRLMRTTISTSTALAALIAMTRCHSPMHFAHNIEMFINW